MHGLHRIEKYGVNSVITVKKEGKVIAHSMVVMSTEPLILEPLEDSFKDIDPTHIFGTHKIKGSRVAIGGVERREMERKTEREALQTERDTHTKRAEAFLEESTEWREAIQKTANEEAMKNGLTIITANTITPVFPSKDGQLQYGRQHQQR